MMGPGKHASWLQLGQGRALVLSVTSGPGPSTVHRFFAEHTSAACGDARKGRGVAAEDQGAVRLCEPLRTLSQTRAQAGSHSHSATQMLLTSNVWLNFPRMAMAAMRTWACHNGMIWSMGLQSEGCHQKPSMLKDKLEDDLNGF